MAKKILLLLLCLSLLAVPALAVTGASHIGSAATVEADGSCRVNMTLRLHLDHAVEKLTFPLPLEADTISLNGGFAAVTRESGAKQVKLPVSAAGEYTFTLSYRLPATLSWENDALLLTLPILNRFSYPIDALEFSVTLPDQIQASPTFLSGYYQEETDDLIACSVSGTVISGYAKMALKDHESITLFLTVDPAMFPYAAINQPLFSTFDGATLVLAVLAILYYCLCLFPSIPKRTRCFYPPDGIAPGDVGTCLTGRGADLSLMVISWAQLGYLLIETDRHGRVLLHKRMEMGNERSRFEVSVYQSLFGKRHTVDGTSFHYARLCRKVATQAPLMGQLFSRKSGNPWIFRALCCAAGACSGVSLALTLTYSESLQILLGILLAAACGIASFIIQSGGKCLPLRDKTPMAAAIFCGILWIGGGVLAEEIPLTLPIVLFQFLAGLAAAFGGRRTALALQGLAQLQALRGYMTTATAFDLHRLVQANPNYYYELAPYALAMGVDKGFARRFGKLMLPECSFLRTGHTHQRTASEWATHLRTAYDKLNARQKRLPIERLTQHK